MQNLINILKVYFIFMMIFLLCIVIFKKKVESIVLEREIYLLELKNKELKRKNQILKTEIAKRKDKNKESLIYYWKIYGALADYENQKVIQIIIE
jgi:cell division protein FtsB